MGAEEAPATAAPAGNAPAFDDGTNQWFNHLVVAIQPDQAGGFGRWGEEEEASR
jgi:hypothetical protein